MEIIEDTEEVAEETEAEETEAEVDVEEDEIDKKTARKYIKPRKNWFKKKMKPMIEQDIPERAAEVPSEDTAETTDVAATVAAGAAAIVADTSEAAKETPVAEPVEEKKPEPPKKAPIQGGAIKSGGFALSGISVDYRPTFFGLSLGENKLKNVKYTKSTNEKKLPTEEKPKQSFLPKKNQSNLSLGSPTKTSNYKSSKPKNISFTFKGDNQKK